MTHWRTTLLGIAQGIGWLLLGIALYADLSGQPKSMLMARLGLVGCILIGIGVILHGLHSADKQCIHDNKDGAE